MYFCLIERGQELTKTPRHKLNKAPDISVNRANLNPLVEIRSSLSSPPVVEAALWPQARTHPFCISHFCMGAVSLEPNSGKHAARRVLWRVLPSKARGPRAGKEQLGNAKMWVDEKGVLNAESDNLGLSLQIRAPDEESRFEFSEPYALKDEISPSTKYRAQSQA